MLRWAKQRSEAQYLQVKHKTGKVITFYSKSYDLFKVIAVEMSVHPEQSADDEFDSIPEISRKWNDKNYYYPIPLSNVQRNPNLKQNPGWQ